MDENGKYLQLSFLISRANFLSQCLKTVQKNFIYDFIQEKMDSASSTHGAMSFASVSSANLTIVDQCLSTTSTLTASLLIKNLQTLFFHKYIHATKDGLAAVVCLVLCCIVAFVSLPL